MLVLGTFSKADLITMMQLLFAGKVGVPKQLFVNTDPSSIPAAVLRAGLSLPLGKSALVTVPIDFLCTYVHSTHFKVCFDGFYHFASYILYSEYVGASMSSKQGTMYLQIMTISAEIFVAAIVLSLFN
jgi:hypothetical protein